MASLSKGLGCGLLAAGLTAQPAAAADGAVQLSSETHPVVAQGPKRANFAKERASLDARHVADWAVDSGDSSGKPFVIVDKKEARVFVFDADGRLRGAAPALLGQARGDDSVPGIGERELSKIRPEEKTTPAGRFVAALGGNMRGEDVLWVDYEGAVSMHRVLTTNPKEPPAAPGHGDAARQPHFLWLHQYSGEVLRERRAPGFYRDRWHRLRAAGDQAGPQSIRVL